ncbi:DUF3079 domain-containing protein [Undibacterium sp. CY21W]|uniref:DUF3079 domain-containing protein n=1 Tax=Undibacterium sp. CY21W TaxID=2762293 RepID=UPI00164C8755|nr:DUF3079 domain-containing protein [Undibacterium sp. CY21W]MBC3927525.1 DUF3079 domain-containing protein [Undibacterium sp. CY21W]
MAKKFPAQPKNPERICWGCDEYCPADAMRCGNGADRTAHPAELFGDDWQAWEPKVVIEIVPADKIDNADATLNTDIHTRV